MTTFVDWIGSPGESRNVIVEITPPIGAVVRVAWTGTLYGGEYYAPRLKALPAFSRTVPASGGEWASAGAGRLQLIDPAGDLDLFGHAGAAVSIKIGGPALAEIDWATLFAGYVGYTISRSSTGWELELQTKAIQWDTTTHLVGTTATTLDTIFAAIDSGFRGQAASEGIDYNLHAFNADAALAETGSRLLKRYSEGLPIVYGYDRAGTATLKKVSAPSGSPTVMIDPTVIMGSGDTQYWTHESHFHTYRNGWGNAALNDSETTYTNPTAATNDPAATDSDRQSTTLYGGDQGVAAIVGALFGQDTRRRLFRARVKGYALALDLTDGVAVDYPRFGISEKVGRIVGIADNVGTSITTDLVILL
jgi:hypothetical protein